MTESEEGLEAAHIAICGGTVNVTSNDDGVNAAGGSSSTSTQAGSRQAAMGGGGMGGGETVGDYSVDITGGILTINSQGDGLDSNGNATISGGTVVVNGPSNDGNGALDVNGELAVTGGTVAAAGSAGMAVTPGNVLLPVRGPAELWHGRSGRNDHPARRLQRGTWWPPSSPPSRPRRWCSPPPRIRPARSTPSTPAGRPASRRAWATERSTARQQQGTVTAGEYTAARGPGGR